MATETGNPFTFSPKRERTERAHRGLQPGLGRNLTAGASPVWVVTTAVRRHSEEHAPHRHSGRVHFYRGGRKDQGGEGFGPKRYPRCCTADR
ncbi:hypothetical protein NQZ68_028922 [Dissostichus eleginoides]|nr:hypothetical protein NQZ68_028922 [Dissostichus eleginoides]